MAPKITKPKGNARSKAKVKPTPPGPPSTSADTSSNSPDPLFFYGHTFGPYDLFSQHYACTFTAPAPSGETLTFLSAEQYMMYHKALLFADIEIAAQIMAAPEPAVQKALGRKVSGFDDEVWKANRERIVEEGNWWKFVNGVGAKTEESGKGLRERLMETGERELVEASPRDRIWGIGFGKNNAEANRGRWGLNLLGKALMRVRERLRGQEGEVEGDEKMAGE